MAKVSCCSKGWLQNVKLGPLVEIKLTRPIRRQYFRFSINKSQAQSFFLFGSETPCKNCFDLLFKSEVWGQISDCGNWGCELGWGSFIPTLSHSWWMKHNLIETISNNILCKTLCSDTRFLTFSGHPWAAHVDHLKDVVLTLIRSQKGYRLVNVMSF